MRSKSTSSRLARISQGSRNSAGIAVVGDEGRRWRESTAQLRGDGGPMGCERLVGGALDCGASQTWPGWLGCGGAGAGDLWRRAWWQTFRRAGLPAPVLGRRPWDHRRFPGRARSPGRRRPAAVDPAVAVARGGGSKGATGVAWRGRPARAHSEVAWRRKECLRPAPTRTGARISKTCA